MASITDDLVKQRDMAKKQEQEAKESLVKHKTMLREQIADLDKHISELQTQRSTAQAALSKIG